MIHVGALHPSYLFFVFLLLLLLLILLILLFFLLLLLLLLLLLQHCKQSSCIFSLFNVDRSLDPLFGSPRLDEDSKVLVKTTFPEFYQPGESWQQPPGPLVGNTTSNLEPLVGQ